MVRCLAVLAVLAAAAEPAAAHHVMDGALPRSALAGLLSGLGHPIIGIDHLAALIAVACLAAVHPAASRLMLAYVAAMVAGAALHAAGLAVPSAEVGIAVSLIALGIATFWRSRLPPRAAAGLFLLTGLVHGYALGESIVGAEPTPLAAYFIGLLAIQSAIGLVVVAILRGRDADDKAMAPLAVKAVGAVALFLGFAAFLGA